MNHFNACIRKHVYFFLVISESLCGTESRSFPPKQSSLNSQQRTLLISRCSDCVIKTTDPLRIIKWEVSRRVLSHNAIYIHVLPAGHLNWLLNSNWWEKSEDREPFGFKHSTQRNISSLTLVHIAECFVQSAFKVQRLKPQPLHHKGLCS